MSVFGAPRLPEDHAFSDIIGGDDGQSVVLLVSGEQVP